MALPAPTTPTLGRILDRLGTLLTLEAGPADVGRAATSVVVDDPADPPVIPERAIVLGVGIADEEQLVRRIGEVAAARAAAIVVREAVPVSTAAESAAARHHLPVLGLIRGASWVQIATMLVGSLDLGSPGDLAPGATGPGPDLFELAESIAAMLQAPVTIEDLSSRVLAFSADQAGTDEPRRQTILGLQVPTFYEDLQRRRGWFRRIYSSDRPVYLEPAEDGSLPRVVMRVRAGDEMLGSIWAVAREQLTPQREQGMVEAARVVAMSILRARLSADSSQRLRLEHVTMLLEGGARAREAARQLGLAPAPACVVAFATRGEIVEDDAVRLAAEMQRAAAALTMYFTALYPRALAALVGGVIYAVVPLRGRAPADAGEAERIAREFIARLDGPDDLVAGVGGVVTQLSDLMRSRREADAALRVLRARNRQGARVAAFDEVQVESLMHRISDDLAADGVTLAGPLAALRAYDDEHGTALVATLRAYLENLGDVTTAATAVHVHKNTFRYRLARLSEVGGIDLGDADARFGLLLQLRLFLP